YFCQDFIIVLVLFSPIPKAAGIISILFFGNLPYPLETLFFYTKNIRCIAPHNTRCNWAASPFQLNISKKEQFVLNDWAANIESEKLFIKRRVIIGNIPIIILKIAYYI